MASEAPATPDSTDLMMSLPKEEPLRVFKGTFELTPCNALCKAPVHGACSYKVGNAVPLYDAPSHGDVCISAALCDSLRALDDDVRIFVRNNP